MIRLKNILIFFSMIILSACSQAVSTKGESSLSEQEISQSAEANESSTTPAGQRVYLTSTPQPTPSVNAYPVSTTQPTALVITDQQLNPLTGLPVDDAAILERHLILVKLANWPREERPQAGLSQADMVFEYYIGSQMNQFLALYYGEEVQAVGPVRSGRLVDSQIANLYQGFLLYANAELAADEVLQEDLGPRALKFGDLPCPPLCGGADTASGDAFVDTAALTAYLRENDLESTLPDLAGMTFQMEPARDDGPGRTLQVSYADFSIMQWRYDERSQSYALWTESEAADGLALAPLTDRNNDLTIHFDNIVVLYTTYKSYTDTLHDVSLIDQEGYQAMMLFRDGRVSFGAWVIPGVNKPLVFETPDGNPLPLKPGRTWVVMVGQSSITNQAGNGEWEIDFRLP